MLVWEDEGWFSRFAQPTLNAWTLRGKAVALEQREWHKEDEEGKAVTCYDALEEETGQVLLRFSPGQPNSSYTLSSGRTSQTRSP